MTELDRTPVIFSAQDLRRLGGMSLERQVIEILLEVEEPMRASAIRAQLIPPPSDDAMRALLDRLRHKDHITDYPSGDPALAPLIGLPGWKVTGIPVQVGSTFGTSTPGPTPPIVVRPLPAIPAAALQPKENSMSKAKRAPRVDAEKADQAVETLLRNATAPLAVATIARDAELTAAATKGTLKRLASRGIATSEGKGRAAKWGSVGHALPTIPATLGAALAPAGTPAVRKVTNGKARFGFFSDGEIEIATARCQGTLSQDDFASLFEYAKRHGFLAEAA